MGAWTVAIAALVGVAILVGLRQAFLAHTRRPSTAVISSKSTQGVYVERWHLFWNPKRLMIVLHRFSGVDLDAPHNHLGYSLTWHKAPKLKIAPTSLKRLEGKIREVLKGAQGRSLTKVIAELNPALRGWMWLH